MLARVLHKPQHPDDTMTRFSYLTENQEPIIHPRLHTIDIILRVCFICSVDGSTPANSTVRVVYFRPSRLDTYVRGPEEIL